ncbi:MAG: O-antigen ligase family protein [Anaerolineae bacterium]
MMVLSIRRDDRQLITLLGLIAAIVFGFIAGTQDIAITAWLLAGIGLAVMAVVTPLAALMVLLVLAPMRTLIATESAIQLPLDIGQLLAGVLLLVWFVTKVAQRVHLLRFVASKVYLPLLIFVIAGAFTALSAFSMGAWLTEWLKWVLMLGLVVLLLNVEDDRAWEWLVLGLVMAGLANALVGLYTFFGGSGALHLLINNRFFRAFGTFGQPNPFGGFMGLLAPLALMAAYAHLCRLWQQWQRLGTLSWLTSIGFVFYGVSAALIALGLVASWSRGAWLAFGVSMLVMLFALPRRWWQGALLVMAVGLLGFGAWLSGRLPASITDRIGSATQELFVLTDVRGVDVNPENYAIVERLSHWQAALNMAQAHPWLGVGLGNYEIAYNQYRLLNWREPLGHAHNYYLNVLAEAGMIGASAYLVFLVTLFYFSWQISRKHPDDFARALGVGLLGTWVYLMIHSLTDNLYVNNVFMHLGVMIGVLAMLHRHIDEGGQYSWTIQPKHSAFAIR